MAESDLDSIDWRILALLQSNSRLSNADIAGQVGLSPSPCLRRVRRLEKAGYIAAYRAVLDPRALGFSVIAFARLTVEWPRAKTLRDEIRRLPQVVACYILTGEQGVLLKIVARDLNEYANFLFNVMYRLPGVNGIQSSVLLESVKSSELTPLPIEGEPQARRPRKRR
ncbi:MAG TPA: Lrp/AsnC family transcriptional regulator [Candidatus Baltobacteraceae bacterium]|jgi:Lrp/AsnC family leucine-responsive transcriptional regulator|nr:Lrp/AsnC family transcriptional regulator [Candidatus Baltobacteraceae bacterium]